MGIWVVILEAVATEGDRRGLGIEPGALDDLAEELAGHYAVVSERPGAYETELWVEEGTAGGAVLAAQFLMQAAVRYLGLPAWETVRAEARDAHALEIGLIDWPEPPAPGDDEPAELEAAPVSVPPAEPIAVPAAKRQPATKARVKKTVSKKTVSKTTVSKRAGAKKAVSEKAGAKEAAPKAGARRTVTTKAATTRARKPRA